MPPPIEPVTRVVVRLTASSLESVIDRLLAMLERRATYRLTFCFEGFSRPDLASSLLDRYCAANPFSVLDLVLASGDPEEVARFLAATDALPLRPVPCFHLFSRLSASRELGFPTQVSRSVLCPWRRIPALAALQAGSGFGRWALLDGSFEEMKEGLRVAARCGWRDGALVRTAGTTGREILFAPLAFHFLLAGALPLRFEDPLADLVYRVCLLQEPVQGVEFPAHEVQCLDGELVHLAAPLPGADRETLSALYSGVLQVLDHALSLQFAAEIPEEVLQ